MVRIAHMKQVFIYPAAIKGNTYIARSREVLMQAGYDVKPFPGSLKGLLRLRGRREAIILNWFEERLASPKPVFIQFILSVFTLLYCKAAFKRIIWVQHNINSHDSKGGRARRLLIRALEFVSSDRVTHRPLTGCHYIPHPIYKAEKSIHERSTPFLYYGLIKSYKGLVELLSAWPQQESLKMIGFCPDKNLELKILELISKRNLKVEWENAFAERDYLNEEIAKARCVVIPHVNGSMLVSGAAFEALANGANVLMRRGDTADYFLKSFDGVEVFELESLSKTISNLHIVDSITVKSSVAQVCADELVSREWRLLLER